MTAPDRPTPPDGWITNGAGARELQGYTDETVRNLIKKPYLKAFGDARAGLTDGLFKGIADAIRGIARPGFEPVREAFRDGQLELQNRLDLLDGVRGYCQAYMSKNINAEWGLDNTRQLPFDAQLGPRRGAHVDGGKGGIVLDDPGLWTISLMATARWTAYTSSWLDADSVRVTLRVHRPNGDVFSEKRLQYMAGKAAVSPTLSVPVVIPDPGFYITVEAYSSRWRWWDGGTKFSSLAVVKHDHRAINQGEATVPDERKQ